MALPSSASKSAAGNSPAGLKTAVLPVTSVIQPIWLRTIVYNFWIPLAILLFIPIAHRIEPGSQTDHASALPYYFRILTLVGINITLALSLQLINGISGQFSLGHAGFMAIGAYLAGYATNTYGTITTPDGDQIAFADPGGVLGYFIALLVAVLICAAVVFGIFIAIRQSRRIAAPLPGVLLLALIVWLIADISVAYQQSSPAWYLVWSRLIGASSNLFTGLLKIVPTLSAILGHLPDAWHAPATFFIALVGGGIMAAIAGLIIGLPTLRLRGDYLAIATLGFAEIIRVAIVNSDALGGATGLSVSPYHLDNDDGHPIRFIFPWVWGTALITFLAIYRLARSPTGKALAAVREDEIAAAAVGIDPTRHKVLAFVIGAFFAGVAGGLYAHYDGYLNTNSFGFMKSVELVVIVTLGGLGSLWGAGIAAIALTILPEALDNAGGVLPAGLAKPAAWISQNRMVIYALLLIAIMLLRSRWRDIWRWIRATAGRGAKGGGASGDGTGDRGGGRFDGATAAST